MKATLLLLAVLALAGCTPTRSSIKPPYVLDGKSYSAKELEDLATQACAVSSKGQPLPPHPFTTDGCSLYKDDGWRACCIKHDVAYWCGAGARKDADVALRACVREVSSKGNSNVMYSGVRVGGWRFWPFPWRFGYGHAWPHHKPLVK